MNYLKGYNKLLESMHPSDGGIPDGLVRQNMRMRYNASFFNPEFYRDRPKGLGIEVEKNRLIRDPIFEDVLSLCLHTDVVKLTGLSLADLMHLDYPTYTRIAEAVTKDKQEKIRIMEKQQHQIDERTRSIKDEIKK